MNVQPRPSPWELQDTLADMWREVLDTSDLPSDCSFFELGGTSLHAMRILTRIRERIGVDVSVRVLLENPTLQTMAAALAAAMTSPAADWAGVVPSPQATSFVRLKASGAFPPLFLLPPTTGQPWSYAALASEPSVDRQLFAGRAVDLDWRGDLLDLDEAAALYLTDMKRIQPSGPYLVGGYSGGGSLAFEVACHLESSGQSVHLIMLDAYAPVSRARLARRSARMAGRRAMSALSRSGAVGRWLVSRLGWNQYLRVLLNIRVREPMTAAEVRGMLRAAFPTAAARQDLGTMSLEGLCTLLHAEIRPLFSEELWREISRVAPAEPLEWLHQLKLVHKNADYDLGYRPRRMFGGTMTMFGATGNKRIAGWQRFCRRPIDVRRFPVESVRGQSTHLSFLAPVNARLWIEDLMALLRASAPSAPAPARTGVVTVAVR